MTKCPHEGGGAYAGAQSVDTSRVPRCGVFLPTNRPRRVYSAMNVNQVIKIGLPCLAALLIYDMFVKPNVIGTGA